MTVQPDFLSTQTKKASVGKPFLTWSGLWLHRLSDNSGLDKDTVPVQFYLSILQPHLRQDAIQVVPVFRTLEVHACEVVEYDPDNATVLAVQDGMSVLPDFLFHKNMLVVLIEDLNNGFFATFFVRLFCSLKESSGGKSRHTLKPCIKSRHFRKDILQHIEIHALVFGNVLCLALECLFAECLAVETHIV